MPAVRTTPTDVLIRVPKVEPYSNRYVAPSVRAKQQAASTTSAPTSDLPAPPPAPAPAAVHTIAPNAGPSLNNVTSTAVPAASALPPPETAATNSAAATTTSAHGAAASTAAEPSGADADKAEGGEPSNERRERGNSPILPFLCVEREESQTVELSKAATSSAGWNSLLVWARRQRGAQWDESTALWQVDRHSREYYSFCQHPATTDRSKQPQDEIDPPPSKHAHPIADAFADALAESHAHKPSAADEDDDKGPTRVSSRNKPDDAAAANTASPPPVAHGRSARLLRR